MRVGNMKSKWSERNLFVKQFIKDGISIVDYGCGHKDILQVCKPSDYLGIDITEGADLNLNLNSDFTLDRKFDLGLVLGVLEYVDNPSYTLSNIKKYATEVIVLVRDSKKAPEWRQRISLDDLKRLMEEHFYDVSFHYDGRHHLAIGKTK